MINALTIDVEDYYHVGAFESVIPFEDWESYESRVEKNTYRILDILDEYKTAATFFVLGWIAEKHPQLVKTIFERGHEIASHGYSHQRIYNQDKEKFREETRRSKHNLEDIVGHRVIGYRAASYSITADSLWALDILAEEGFIYDSSIFPIHHDRYGIPNGKRFPYVHNFPDGRNVMEFPLSTVSIFGRNVPVAGGGYLRLLPYPFIRWGVKHINERENAPAIIYLHPWEIDPGQPRINCGRLSKFRHYTNLHRTETRFKQLLCDFRFDTLRSLMKRMTNEDNRSDI